MAVTQLIHITDLHYQGTAEDNRRLQRLISDIEKESLTPNTLICFSGDLTHSGTEDQFSSLFANFFGELDRYPRIYSCPGNHDIQRARTSREITDQVRKLSLKPDGQRQQNISPFLSDCPLENYLNTQLAVCSFRDSGFFTSYDTSEHFDLISINTAWLSRSGDNEYSDQGRLEVDELSLDLAIKAMSENKIRILMMHHPVEWLTQKSQLYMNQLIQDNFDLVLYGHEHSAGAKHVTTQSGEVVFLESSAAKAAWSHGSNGYSIVKIDVPTKSLQIKFRSYSAPLSRYIDGNDIVDTGYFYPRASDKAFWAKELSENPVHLLEKSKKVAQSLNYRDIFEKNFPAKIKLEHDPITPMFRQVHHGSEGRNQSVRLRVDECLNLVDGISFFGGPRDSGLTTSSYIAYIHICRRIDEFRAIPIYINLEEAKVNKASLLREVQRGAVASYTHHEAEILCNSGAIFFLFDSICIQQSSLLSDLRSTLKTHFPDCKAAVFYSLDKRSIGLDTDGSVQLDPLNDTIFQICQLTAKEIKGIIDSKAINETAQVKENLLNNAIISFKAMDEPVYPTTVSILVDTLRQLPDFRPINRVRLLDRYIECLLGRYTLEDVKTGHFNSSDKANLLSYIAGVMVNRGKVYLSREELTQAVSDYSEAMLLELPPDAISEFVEKGILFASHETVTFRADYLFSYFVAKEMARNSSLFSDITEGENFFAYHNEIVYYGELEGVDNTALLNRAFDFVSDIEGLVTSQYESHGIIFRDEWEKLVNDGVSSDGVLAETIKAIASETPSDLSKDISRSRDLNSRHRSRGVGVRVTIKELEAKWLITLRVYMQLMKHSTSLLGTDKIKHLTKILDSLFLFSQNLAVKREMISRQPAYRHGGIIYINPLAAIDVEKSKREFKFSAPMSVAIMAAELLGSSQLNLALQKISGVDNDFFNFIVGNLLLSIPSKKNQTIIAHGIASCETPTLQLSSLKLLKEKYLSYNASKDEVLFCKDIIDSLSGQRSVKGRINVNVLEKQRLISEIRKKKGGED